MKQAERPHHIDLKKKTTSPSPPKKHGINQRDVAIFSKVKPEMDLKSLGFFISRSNYLRVTST
jgi:hypothetical protein